MYLIAQAVNHSIHMKMETCSSARSVGMNGDKNGSSSVVKIGTKVKSIRLVEGDHNIDCKIDGFGAMSLKSQFVKKA